VNTTTIHFRHGGGRSEHHHDPLPQQWSRKLTVKPATRHEGGRREHHCDPTQQHRSRKPTEKGARDAKEAVVNITTTQLRNTRAESGRRSTLSYAQEAVVHNATSPQTKLGRYFQRQKHVLPTSSVDCTTPKTKMAIPPHYVGAQQYEA